MEELQGNQPSQKLKMRHKATVFETEQDQYMNKQNDQENKIGSREIPSMNRNLIYENSVISHKWSKNKPVNQQVSDVGGKKEREREKGEAELLHHCLPKISSISVYYLQHTYQNY